MARRLGIWSYFIHRLPLKHQRSRLLQLYGRLLYHTCFLLEFVVFSNFNFQIFKAQTVEYSLCNCRSLFICIWPQSHHCTLCVYASPPDVLSHNYIQLQHLFFWDVLGAMYRWCQGYTVVVANFIILDTCQGWGRFVWWWWLLFPKWHNARERILSMLPPLLPMYCTTIITEMFFSHKHTLDAEKHWT